ncbi:MAG: DNA translocase FtsK, partial [Oscillospiraceae bacterium]|nr:DNA translocase FtsK [Oscillospiraceae bacterium]
FSKPQPEGGILDMVKELYANGRQLRGGGVFSMLTGIPLLKLLDFTGAAIVICLIIFVLVMIITGSTISGLMKKAAAPARKLGEAYTIHKENAAQQTTQIPAQTKLKEEPAARPTAKNRFDFDISMDGDVHPVTAAPAKNDAVSQARDRLLGAAHMVNTGKPLEKPAEPVVAPTPAPVPGGIDDLISRAIGGEAVIDDPELTAETAAEPRPTVQEGSGLNFRVTGDALKKPDGETFVVPPVDPDPIPAVEETPTPAIKPAAAVRPKPQPKPAEEPLPEAVPEPVAEVEPVVPAYRFPPVELLNKPSAADSGNVTQELKENAERLVETLKSFGVQTRVVDIARGPAITRYELQPNAGVKISRITGLADDIALSLASSGVRIEAPIPNKSAVGIEVPNKVISPVLLREVIDSPAFEEAQSRLSVALGKDIAGNLAVADLSRMPHLLIAGSTGSGKSVCINSFIVSLLYKANPDQVKLMMIDPKVVELGAYNGIPHLLVPVVTDPRKAAGALCWAVNEMMTRYKVFSANNVRDITGYNRLAESSDTLNTMPHIVIIIDELSDLMMVCPNEVEDYICRLAQMARAAGMHLVIATQRPSVDVITGIIKANIPSRIAFAVSSQVDSRTILDLSGAEKLLGRGDMLYYPVGSAKPTRVQGCFVTDQEVEAVVEFVKNDAQNASYDASIIEEIDRQAANTGKKGGGGGGAEGGSEEDEELVQAAIEAVVEAGQASTSYLQRKLKLGYARAARIVDELEARGIVGPFEGSKPRQVLITKERWYEMKLNSDQ